MQRQEKTPRPPVKQLELGLTDDGQHFVLPGWCKANNQPEQQQRQIA
jgi:hypothetical protein